jgi:flavorubredoxin
MEVRQLCGSGRSVVKTLVMYESMFGNTRDIAEAVAAGLRASGSTVTVVEVGTTLPTDLAVADLLVVAAPTHALALSSPRSRADAVARGAGAEHAAIGVREWLAGVEAHPAPGPRVAAVFDTRLSKVRHWPGSAGRQLARRMRGCGFHVLDRMSFYVSSVTGPLVDGELARAEAWGCALADMTMAAEGTEHVRA